MVQAAFETIQASTAETAPKRSESLYLLPEAPITAQPQQLRLPQPLVRASAFLIDIVLIGVSSAIVANLLLFAYHRLAHANYGLTPLAMRNPLHIRLFKDLVSLVIFDAYMALSLWYSDGLTVGKSLLGLQVVRTNGAVNWSFGQALGRALAYQLSYLIFGLGFALSLIRKDRKSLHDMLTGTQVCVRQS